MTIAGKVVLITGAARGLGFEYAQALGAQGAQIVAGDVADCSGAAAAAGNGAIGVHLDVTDMASCEGMVEFLGDKYDRGLEVIRTGQSIQRTLVPADLAGTVAWLIGDGSQFVTGQTIAVDGGTVML